MEQKSPLLKASMNAGIIMAVISILYSVIIWVAALMEKMGLMANLALGISNLFIMVIILVILTKRYRINYLENTITFKEAFVFGLLVVVFSTIITSLYNYIFNNFIDPGYQERIMASMQDKLYNFMSSKGVPDAQIEEQMNKMQARGAQTPIQILKQSIIFGLIGGSIMSLISSAIVKKNINKDDAFEEAMEEVKTED